MNRTLRLLALPVMLLLASSACTWFSTQPAPSATQAALLDLSLIPRVELSVQAEAPTPLNTPGQIIQYKYNLKNTGSVSILGAVTFTGAQVTCPDVNTIGNLDGNLDPDEVLICTSSYTLTQADIDKGSLTSATNASVNGTLSNLATSSIPTVPTAANLTLTKTANPPTYDHVGQTITITYQITNTGSTSIGPTQFTISDKSLGATTNCGDANASLAPNASLTCTANYVITQADMDAASVSTEATASDGTGSSKPASATLTKNGANVRHTVVAGEWLWQIARCYGADPYKISQANPQLSNASQIDPGTLVTVPNIGSQGPVFGPPCVLTYTVQSGDTWSSIAQKYGTEVGILQRANPEGLAAGHQIVVPRNGFTTP